MTVTESTAPRNSDSAPCNSNESYRADANSAEQQYLELVHNVLSTGNPRCDRTGTGTLSLFNPSPLRFSLRDNQYPLLTTKRVFFRGVVEELLWMLRGQTDARILSDKGIRIWDKNGSREELDKRGFHDRQEGDLGPVYGFQWRHWGAKYRGCDADYEGDGRDQVRDVLERIKQNPADRRIVLNSWNVSDLDQMVLPPCHMFCQFYVTNDSHLDCALYQRSADVGLGLPFNIASYSLLTIIFAHLTNLRPGTFTHFIGDAHIYSNHTEALRKQLEREPRRFPRLWVRPGRVIGDPQEFEYRDFVLEDYHPHGKLEMEMSA